MAKSMRILSVQYSDMHDIEVDQAAVRIALPVGRATL
jgi:hypothetical protein